LSKLQTPVALIIMDGWGMGRPDDPYNAIARAATPHLDLLMEIYPTTTLRCSGEDVGLPDGQMGNSEVGHLNIGAGRIVYQELTRINKAIRDGEFFTNSVLLQVMEATKAKGGALHLMGLVSDGGVHSHSEHLYALVQMAKQQGLTEVYIHAFLDGRDVPPCSAAGYIDELTAKLAEIGLGKIATVSGRYYAMDRDRRWDRTAKAYAAIVDREGIMAATAAAAVRQAYDRGETDEFVEPTVIDGGQGVKPQDGVFFFNFRPDRARQLTRAFVDRDFAGFNRRKGYLGVTFATMTQYDETLPVPAAFLPEYIRNTVGEAVSKAGLRQLRIAETEKYAHVTYFFNGGDERPFPGEDRILIPSPKIATYDLQPEMSAPAVTDTVIEKIRSRYYDFIILNFANGDMVGHTGKFEAAVKAVETVDQCVGRIVAAMRDYGGITCLTADHGNAEEMVDLATGEPHTAHTSNPVPFILVSDAHREVKLRAGRLADIAPTLLQLAKLEQPAEMTGESLIISKEAE